MKKKLRGLFIGAVALFSFVAQKAEASHWQGGDMTYSCVAPGIYTVQLTLYRDCSSTVLPSTTNILNLKSVGCNTGRNVNMTKLGNNRIGNPYCAAIPVSCTTAGRANYEEITFTSTVTFSTAERNCPEWLLSWTECCRPSSANLLNAANYSLYVEAMLKVGTNNSSVQFGSLAIPYVNHSQPILISSFATDSDGDSLVYSLQNPLDAPTNPIAFGTYSSALVYNHDSTKYTAVPAGTFSSGYPIISYFIDWNLPMPITPVKKFLFDTKTGSIGFAPNFYDATSPASAGKNKYSMVVQVDEYRKINGVVTKVGTVRRDMFINVLDSGKNQNPNVNNPVVNGQAITEADVINLRPGTPLNMQFATADGNALDVLTLQSDVSGVLSGATFNKTTANKPTATISWTPTATDVSNYIKYFHVTVQDDACPVKGYQIHTFGVKVSATGGVTGTKEIFADAAFSAFPNPFSSELNFKFDLKTKAESILIYNLLGQQIDQISLHNSGLGKQNRQWQNAHKYAAGTYVAKLVSGNKTVQTVKFTKLQ